MKTGRPSEGAGPLWADNPEVSVLGPLFFPGFLFCFNFGTYEELAQTPGKKGHFLCGCGVCCSFLVFLVVSEEGWVGIESCLFTVWKQSVLGLVLAYHLGSGIRQSPEVTSVI